MGIFFRRRRPWIVRQGPDQFELAFPEGVPAILIQLGGEIRDVLMADTAAVHRVFPVAYPDDDEREAGYQAMVRGQLIERHQAGIDLIAETATADTLSGDELNRWMTTTNAIRLILGTALDVEEDSELDLDEEDPLFPVQQLYFLMSELLSHILVAFGDPTEDQAAN